MIFVILFVRDELSYDKWIPGTRNLYRVELNITGTDRPPLPIAVTPFPMPEAMRNEVPGVTGMTRFMSEPMTLTIGDRLFPERVSVVDPGFFKLIRSAAGNRRSRHGLPSAGIGGPVAIRGAEIFRRCRSHRPHPCHRPG